MLRKLTCLGMGLLLVVSGLSRADEPARDRARDIHGKIVRVDPDKNVVVVRVGTGNDAKEMEYHLGKATRYYGPNQVVIDDGLRYKGFREGGDLWLRLGDDNRVVSEVRFADPTTDVMDIRGKVVRVDPATGVIVIRTGAGAEAKEVEYTVDKSTAYWATEQQKINDALRYQGFREGADVWYRVGPRGRILSDIRFYDPAVRRPRRP